jgi:hypothetical protein
MKKAHLYLMGIGIFLALLGTDVFAQGDDWYVSAANYARYYHFRGTKADSAATRFQFDIYMGDFYAGGWFEAKHVMNDVGFDNASSKLSQRYFGWENRGFTVHVGNFYKVFDRGLILNAFRDDEVSVDKLLDGGEISWRSKFFDFEALSVKDSSEVSNRPIIRGMRTKFKPFNSFHLGGGYVSHIAIDNSRTNLDEFNVRYLNDFMDGYVEYAQRKYTITDIIDPDIKENKGGDGTYVNVTGFLSYFSALVEYKNYYDLLYDYGSQNMGIMNIPPAVNRQDRLLSTEASNVFTPILGERGYRFDFGVAANDYWGYEIDYSKAYSRSPSTVTNREIFAEMRGNVFGENLFKFNVDFFDFSWQDSFVVSYTDDIVKNIGSFERNEFRPEFEAQIRLDDYRSLELDAYLIHYDYEKPVLPEFPDSVDYYEHNMADSSDYTEQFLNISFIQSPNFRLTVGGSISNRDPSPDPDNMAFIEATFVFGNHELAVFKGDQRGGLVCSGGVCVYHPTFEGLRVTLISRL